MDEDILEFPSEEDAKSDWLVLAWAGIFTVGSIALAVALYWL